MAQQPPAPVDLGLLIVEVFFQDHTQETPYLVRELWTSDRPVRKRPVHDNTRQLTRDKTSMPPRVIRTRNPRMGMAGDPRLRSHGHWDTLKELMLTHCVWFNVSPSANVEGHVICMTGRIVYALSMRIYTHTHTHSQTHIHTLTHTQTHIHTLTHSHTHTLTHTHTHKHTHSHTHTHTHTPTQTNTHTHTHTMHLYVLYDAQNKERNFPMQH